MAEGDGELGPTATEVAMLAAREEIRGRIPAFAAGQRLDRRLVYAYMQLRISEAQTIRSDFALPIPDHVLQEFERRKIDLLTMQAQGLLGRLAEHPLIAPEMPPKPAAAPAPAVPPATLVQTVNGLVAAGDLPVGAQLATKPQVVLDPSFLGLLGEWARLVKEHEAAVMAYNARMVVVRRMRDDHNDWSANATSEYAIMGKLEKQRWAAEDAMAVVVRLA